MQTHDRRRSPPRAENYTYAMMWHRGEMSRRTRCRSSRVAHPIYGRTSFYRSSLVWRVQLRSNFYIYVNADCGDAGLGVSTHHPPLNPSAKDTFTPPPNRLPRVVSTSREIGRGSWSMMNGQGVSLTSAQGAR